MLDGIESLREVEFQDTTGSPRSLALVDVLKRLGQTVLDRYPFQETVLIPMNDLEH